MPAKMGIEPKLYLWYMYESVDLIGFSFEVSDHRETPRHTKNFTTGRIFPG